MGSRRRRALDERLVSEPTRAAESSHDAAGASITVTDAITITVTYPNAVRAIIAKDGVAGLMFRGLETKIFANGLQGILFSILWKQFEEVLFPKK